MNIELYLNIIGLILSPWDEGKILFPIVLIISVIIIIYYVLVLNPQDEKEKNEWIEKNGDKLKLQYVLTEILKVIGNSTPPCSKCNSTELQIWDILNNDITFRCISCKNKFKKTTIKVSDNDGNPIDFVGLLDNYIDFVNFSSKQQNTKLGKYLQEQIKWNFYDVRKGSPLYRGITFNSNPNYIPTENTYDDIKNDEPSRRISQKVMDRVWNRDGGKCVQCGSNLKLEFDHIIPFSKGGSNTYRNIQLLCESCNRSKSNNIG